MSIYHNTRDKIYRDPFGAALTGSTVNIRVYADDEGIVEVYLKVYTKLKGDNYYLMERDPNDYGFYFFDLTPDTAELYWYSFKVNYADGTSASFGARNGRVNGEGCVYLHENPPSFQLTVSKPSYSPAWYKEGIVYQIFPDRYNRDSEYKLKAMREFENHTNGPKRQLVSDWNKKPAYEKDGLGRVTTWDFYGGTLKGIEERLAYLQSLGIKTIYLNPIFDAASNHRYDTANYMHISPLLGNEEDFVSLCKNAKEKGISIILDGVFNHTGCDSIYFNKYKNYGESGAYNDKKSEYRSWYTFDNSKNGYESWWGVADLPSINENERSYREFIYEGEDSVIKHYMKLGAKGWRLDVADELPDNFIAGIKKAIKETDKEGFLLGEVWEDASNKISYSEQREYLLGDELDAVMNYPFRDNMLAFLNGEIDAYNLTENFMSLYENYPKDSFYSNFNLLGSHDSVRLYTALGGNIPHIKSAVFAQMCFPGVPVIYYGDEIGMEGGKDPENRAAFDLSLSKNQIVDIYTKALALRSENKVLLFGDFEAFHVNENVFGIKRTYKDKSVILILNRSGDMSYEFELNGQTMRIEAYETLVIAE